MVEGGGDFSRKYIQLYLLETRFQRNVELLCLKVPIIIVLTCFSFMGYSRILNKQKHYSLILYAIAFFYITALQKNMFKLNESKLFKNTVLKFKNQGSGINQRY